MNTQGQAEVIKTWGHLSYREFKQAGQFLEELWGCGGHANDPASKLIWGAATECAGIEEILRLRQITDDELVIDWRNIIDAYHDCGGQSANEPPEEIVLSLEGEIIRRDLHPVYHCQDDMCMYGCPVSPNPLGGEVTA